MPVTEESAVVRRVPLLASMLAGVLALLLVAAAPAAASPPAEANVIYVYAQVLRATPVYGVESGERRIVAYDIEYRYKGDTYMSRLGHDPGSRLRIRIAVTPAETGPGVR
jgi:hypothetical protein